jgi:hypothetical protein
MDLLFIGGALAGGFYYLGTPLLIYTGNKLQAELLTTPFHLEKLVPDVQEHLTRNIAILTSLGFSVEASVMMPETAPNMRTYMVMMANRNTGEKSNITAILATPPGATPILNFYTEFTCRYASGKIVDTMNSNVIGSFDPLPHETKITFAGQQDLELLYQLHQYIVRHVAQVKPDDTPHMYPPGGAESYLREIWRKGFDEQVEAGIMRCDGNYYRPTFFGAYKMTWRLLFPKAQQLAAQRDRRANEILQAFRTGQG